MSCDEFGFEEDPKEDPECRVLSSRLEIARAIAGSKQVISEVWQCPFCEYRLGYLPEDGEVADMAAIGHLLRLHKVQASLEGLRLGKDFRAEDELPSE